MGEWRSTIGKPESVIMLDWKKNLNGPNLISFYRLVSFPFVLYFAFTGQEKIFAILLIINLISDVLDGLIARSFNLQTEFGAVLDSYADIGMYISAILGVIIFKAEDLAPYWISFTVFIVTYFLPKIIAYYRFRRFPSFHLYSSKAVGYLQGFFFFVLFAFGFNTIFYYIAILSGIASFIEQAVIVLVATKLESNVKGLYWILKERDGA